MSISAIRCAEWSAFPLPLKETLKAAFEGTCLKKDPYLSSNPIHELIMDYLEVDLCGTVKVGFELEYILRDIKTQLELAKQEIRKRRPNAVFMTVMFALSVGAGIPKDHELAPTFNAVYWEIRKVKIEPNIYNISCENLDHKSEIDRPETHTIIGLFESLVNKIAESFLRSRLKKDKIVEKRTSGIPLDPQILRNIYIDVKSCYQSINQNVNMPHLVYMQAMKCIGKSNTAIPRGHMLASAFDTAYWTIRREKEPTRDQVCEISEPASAETYKIIEQIELVLEKVENLI